MIERRPRNINGVTVSGVRPCCGVVGKNYLELVWDTVCSGARAEPFLLVWMEETTDSCNVKKHNIQYKSLSLIHI